MFQARYLYIHTYTLHIEYKVRKNTILAKYITVYDNCYKMGYLDNTTFSQELVTWLNGKQFKLDRLLHHEMTVYDHINKCTTQELKVRSIHTTPFGMM
jgi:hypothetical protein